MRCADGNEDAGFANLQAAEAVKNGDTMDGEFLVDGLANLFHFGEGHGLVGFVIEVNGLAAVGLVADEAIEGDNRAILIGPHLTDNGCHFDGRMEEGEEIVFREGV